MKNKVNLDRNRSAILRPLLISILVLSIPLVAMQFSEEVQWGLEDFIFIGFLLFGAGLAYELIRTKIEAKHRPAVALMIIAAVLLIWVELAVGIFGTPIAGD